MDSEMQSNRKMFNSWTGLMALAVMLAGVAQAQEKKTIKLPGMEAFPFSDGVVVGNTLYVAGQEGTVEAKLAPGGIGPETEAALANIGKVLKEAGFEWKDVVSVTVYLADIKEFGDMNKVYRSVVPDPKPARATVQVAGLVNNARIEVSAIAVKQK
jgi:2-iminobutanoate/2-iminopropanoate deaminase